MKGYGNTESSVGSNDISRRGFIKVAGISTVGLSAFGFLNLRFEGVSIVTNTEDPISGASPSQWAINELEKWLSTTGVIISKFDQLEKSKKGDLIIAVAGLDSVIARTLLKDSKTEIPKVDEAQGLIPVETNGRQVLLVCGFDVRGLVYALLELADRVRYSGHSMNSLNIEKPIVEKPANKIRSLNRLFVSVIEDKPWFNDREMWKNYLTMIATQRFNRFNLSLGIGYDFLQNVTDGYFLFAYPFLLSVPGYNVRIPELPDEERESNLEMLKFISEQTVTKGIQFQLGIWMHGYEWLNTKNPNYTVEGLTAETHGPYCRDAVRRLLQLCPAISGITFRVHGESGVTEGSYNFWKTVFDGVATCGRKVEIDMHAKGINDTMIDMAVATGMPVNVSPKYWAEHLGLPYHQADIREMEIPKSNRNAEGLMNLSAGSRSFTRYGYGDLFKENRQYGVLHRVWPGTQRLLLWGDPEMSSAHSKNFSFCGSAGVDLMEPLSFKGRRGSGIAGDRCAYLDSSLKPQWDWEKYLYSLRVFGRLAYNPETEAEVWRRFLDYQFGKASKPVELALAQASRILPLVTTVHGVSAGNNTYWPEIYINLSLTDPSAKNPYSDTPSPKIFGNVSPMDPQLFMSINDFADQILKGDCNGKYTPVEYAQWVEDYAENAEKHLNIAKASIKDSDTPEFRRLAIDVTILVGLGRFFGARFRSGVLYGIYTKSNDTKALELSLDLYRKARNFWAGLAEVAKNIYKPDITVGENDVIRGHWLDRLPAMDKDLGLLAEKVKLAKPLEIKEKNVTAAIQEAIGRPRRILIKCLHNKPVNFIPGEPLKLELSVEKTVASVTLYFRRVNHAERFKTLAMQPNGNNFQAIVPSEYTNSPYPLQYYFELKESQKKAFLFPGFNEKFTNQPYYVIRNV